METIEKRQLLEDQGHVQGSKKVRTEETPDNGEKIGTGIGEHENEIDKGLLKDNLADESPLNDNHSSPVSETSLSPSPPPSSESLGTLYLETIDRTKLDFDFEKVCSVSLSNINVYACLVCGKYFQGRGKSSYAYFHSVDEDHHVYINLQTLRIYVLPEGYEVHSSTLDDIKYVVDPTYSKAQVAELDHNANPSYNISHEPYWPGFVGLNNIKNNDYANVIIQTLAHVKPLRNYLILEPLESKPETIKRFSILVRKLWNSRAFKSHVSPHELLQYVTVASKKRFTPISQVDPFQFLAWFVNQLHIDLGGSKNRMGSTIIHKVFQGKLRVESRSVSRTSQVENKTTEVPFLFLSLDLPPAPLFQDESARNAIPQVPLAKLLSKYDGQTEVEQKGTLNRYKILNSPPYLILHVKRFIKTLLADERNPTIVTFSWQNLDMSPYVEGATEPIYYNLMANITHELSISDSGSEEHIWKVQLLDKSRGNWFQIQDLLVTSVQKELLLLSESYIQIWERRP